MKPKPQILLSYVNRQTNAVKEVLECESVWVVLYKNKPFNVKTYSRIMAYPGPKYSKTVFVNPGHAFALAKKLNALYKTEDFTVKEVTF